MDSRTAAALTLLAATLLAGGACSSRPTERDLEVGQFRLRVVVPKGWEHLDHGREQIFRKGETRLSLAEFGRAQADSVESISPDSMAVLLFEQVFDARRLELWKRERRAIHGAEWTVLHAWDRVTHANQTRLACVDSGGSLLVLRIDRGSIEEAGEAFEGLLHSIQFVAEDA